MTSSPYVRPTPRQREVVLALLETGSLVAAAERLGISRTAAEVHMHRMRRRMGLRSTEQAIYVLTRAGALSMREI